MAITGWNPGTTAADLHLNDGQLVTIINAAQEAATNMGKVSASVDGVAGQVLPAMQSDAGQIMQGRLNIWHEDYTKIINAFNALNDRAQGMLIVLRNANQGATAGAQSGS